MIKRYSMKSMVDDIRFYLCFQIEIVSFKGKGRTNVILPLILNRQLYFKS